MKRVIMMVLIGLGSFTTGRHARAADPANAETSTLPPGHPPVTAPHGASAGLAGLPAVTGEIIETMDTGNYTYIQVRGADKTIWAATERFEAKVGERVTVPGGMVMKNFQSPTLGRTFEELYFTDRVLREGESESERTLPPGHPPLSAQPTTPASPAQDVVAQPAGGISLAELFARSTELAGQEIVIKGRVTSYTERVMGRNWIHLADGTSAGSNQELVINSTGSTRVGAVITVKGVVAINEDLGHGYQYAVLIKDAELTAE